MWIKPWTCQFCGKCFCNRGRLKRIGAQVPILVALKSEFDEFWTEDTYKHGQDDERFLFKDGDNNGRTFI